MSEPRLCIVCGQDRLNGLPQTCTWCLAASRRALIRVEQLAALLTHELAGRAGAASPMDPSGVRSDDDPMPGGDIMVMLGPGSAGWHHDGDPVDSVLGLLERWETDWRITFGDGAATEQATVAGCSLYLLRRLSHASQHHPAFDEFADDLSEMRNRVEHALRVHSQRSPVPCITCNSRTLVRPHDQRFEWQCTRCHRNYTQEEYWMAVRQHGEAV